MGEVHCKLFHDNCCTEIPGINKTLKLDFMFFFMETYISLEMVHIIFLHIKYIKVKII